MYGIFPNELVEINPIAPELGAATIFSPYEKLSIPCTSPV